MPKAAYFISDIDIQRVDELSAYIAEVPGVITAYGGRYIVRRGEVEVFEGTWRPKALIVVEFPSMEMARRWYASPEYQDVKRRCFKGAARNLILVEGVESS